MRHHEILSTHAHSTNRQSNPTAKLLTIRRAGLRLSAAAVVTFHNDIEATSCLTGIIVLPALLLIYASSFPRGIGFNFAASSHQVF
jgi:hypothetical protein